MSPILKHVCFSISLALSSLALANPNATHPHWGYNGENGPEFWAKIDEHNATCKLGTQQSPIDIKNADLKTGSQLVFNYSPEKVTVVNNGHTIQINTEKTSSINIPSGKYYLNQLHFHTPSEEAISGKRYDMVAHLVHLNDAKEIAVVAVLFKVGAENEALKAIFDKLPQHENDSYQPTTPLDISALLPKDKSYYAYMGSLTTPPCSENVHWQVFKTPVELSAAQLKAFSRLYPMNARPLQPTNNRPIQEVMP